MIDKFGKQLAEQAKYSDDLNYWETEDTFDNYMNILNNTKNEKYAYDGTVIIDYLDVRNL